jgi:hypothetical protein
LKKPPQPSGFEPGVNGDTPQFPMLYGVQTQTLAVHVLFVRPLAVEQPPQLVTVPHRLMAPHA